MRSRPSCNRCSPSSNSNKQEAECMQQASLSPHCHSSRVDGSSTTHTHGKLNSSSSISSSQQDGAQHTARCMVDPHGHHSNSKAQQPLPSRLDRALPTLLRFKPILQQHLGSSRSPSTSHLNGSRSSISSKNNRSPRGGSCKLHTATLASTSNTSNTSTSSQATSAASGLRQQDQQHLPTHHHHHHPWVVLA